MRFSLLCASTALAAGMLLSAGSSGGVSQAIPGGGGSTQAPDTHHCLNFNPELHAVVMRTKGQLKADQSCPYTECFDLPAGAPGYGFLEWCVSATGNCGSGLLPGRWEWLNVFCESTYYCVILPNDAKTLKIKTGTLSGMVKSFWDPKVGNPTDQAILWKDLRASRTCDPSFATELAAFAKSGPYKGECTSVVSLSFIPVTE